MKQEILELEDDRKFLDYEIRDCRIQNKMLKIALSKQHNQCEQMSEANHTVKEEIDQIKSQYETSKTAFKERSAYHS